MSTNVNQSGIYALVVSAHMNSVVFATTTPLESLFHYHLESLFVCLLRLLFCITDTGGASRLCIRYRSTCDSCNLTLSSLGDVVVFPPSSIGNFLGHASGNKFVLCVEYDEAESVE